MLKSLHTGLISLCSIVLVLGCTSTPKTPKVTKARAEGTIAIMTYNVENLFDTIHDPGTNDFTFLPVSYKESNAEAQEACNKQDSDYRRNECLTTDWNDEVLKLKMERLADSVLSAPGGAPDILLLQEVENLRVLQMWNKGYLQQAGYQTEVLIEAEDRRGIDVAVLSKFPLAGEPKSHKIEFTPDKSDKDWKRPLTRGILEVPLKLPNGETLIVYTFHFPSQANPVQERIDAVQTLNKLMQKKNAGTLMIAGGDSNITMKEDISHGLQRNLMASKWKVSHLVGCSQCEGTQAYRGEWSFFDVLLFSPNLMNGTASYQLRPESIEVAKNGNYQLFKDGYPARFKAKSPIGVADHLPVYAEIVPKK